MSTKLVKKQLSALASSIEDQPKRIPKSLKRKKEKKRQQKKVAAAKAQASDPARLARRNLKYFKSTHKPDTNTAKLMKEVTKPRNQPMVTRSLGPQKML